MLEKERVAVGSYDRDHEGVPLPGKSGVPNHRMTRGVCVRVTLWVGVGVMVMVEALVMATRGWDSQVIPALRGWVSSRRTTVAWNHRAGIDAAAQPG